MKSYWNEIPLDYNGTQLSSLFAYRNFSVQGNSIIGFRGKCDVAITEMVDLADVKQEAHIYSTDMLHFIVEVFAMDLEKAVLQQRILTTIVKEIIEVQTRHTIRVIRKGDDLYIDNDKLSVSIATLSPVSAMIHFGINISSEDTPVSTKGLDDLDIDPIAFAKQVLATFISEMEDIYMARCKVRGVL